MLKFKVNKYITLKLENAITNIYINEELFKQCKYLLLNIPVKEVSSFDEIDSVDEAAEKLNHSEEPRKGYIRKIPPEVEFWGHCSNMQVWYENNYNTRLLHSNLAFPLLKELTRLGDPIAKRVFKEEIAKRLINGSLQTVLYLLIENYIIYLNDEEIDAIMNDSIEKDKIIFKRGKDIDNLGDIINAMNLKQFNFLINHPKFNFLGDFISFFMKEYVINKIQPPELSYYILYKLEKLKKKEQIKGKFLTYLEELKKYP